MLDDNWAIHKRDQKMPKRTLHSSLILISALILSACESPSPANEVYYRSAKERGLSVNEPFTIIANVLEKDGIEISRREDTNYGYRITQNGNRFELSGATETRSFYPVSLSKWKQQTLNSEFVLKLDNPRRAVDAFLSDVVAYYVGGQARIFMKSAVMKGNQQILPINPEDKYLRLNQGEERIIVDKPGGNHRVFRSNPDVMATINAGDEWTHAFTEDTTGAILLSNETRTVFTLIENGINNSIVFTNILIEDGLFELSEGKFKYSMLHEDYSVETAFLMPSRNFTCARLLQAYRDKQLEAGIQIASSVILGIIQSYTNYTSTTMSGHAYSYNTGNTYVASGYATTYDYRYIGERASEVISATAIAGKSTYEIKRLMQQYDCKLP